MVRRRRRDTNARSKLSKACSAWAVEEKEEEEEREEDDDEEEK
jgi:hypothetical protein